MIPVHITDGFQHTVTMRILTTRINMNVEPGTGRIFIHFGASR